MAIRVKDVTEVTALIIWLLFNLHVELEGFFKSELLVSLFHRRELESLGFTLSHVVKFISEEVFLLMEAGLDLPHLISIELGLCMSISGHGGLTCKTVSVEVDLLIKGIVGGGAPIWELTRLIEVSLAQSHQSRVAVINHLFKMQNFNWMKDKVKMRLLNRYYNLRLLLHKTQ